VTRSLSLYNPRDTDPAQLDQLLTGRSALLDEILGDLRQQARGKTRQHWLLRGQRGIGKTHLEGVIYHRVKTTPELAKAYLPLWLGEADVYEVYSAAKLLEKIGERLAEEVKDGTIRERIRNIEGTGDDEMLFAALDELLTAEAKGRQRILLVLVENLDALFERFAPKDRSAQMGQLRSLLLHNPWVLFIGTTPTRYLKGLESPKEPLYAQLKTRDLDRLTELELGELYKRLAVAQGRKDIEEALFGSGEGALRLRVIHQLTGGLPRSAAMAFTLLQANTHGLKPMVEEMRELLEKQTAYFEARLARLASRESAIVTAMALAPRNLTLKEIAARSRLPERTLSTLMDRLEKDGHVRPAPGSTGKGKGTYYELSEELFRLWYQYRSGRPVLEPLVRFIANWFDHQQLEEAARQIREGSAGDANGDAHVARLTLLQVEEALRIATSEEGRRARQRLWDECRKAIRDGGADSPGFSEAIKKEIREAISNIFSAIEAGDPASGITQLERLSAHVNELPPSASAHEVARVTLVVVASLLQEKGRFRDAVSLLEQAASAFEKASHADALSWLCVTLRSLGSVYYELGATQKFRATMSRILAHFAGRSGRLFSDATSYALMGECVIGFTPSRAPKVVHDLSEWLRRYEGDPDKQRWALMVEFCRAIAHGMTGDLPASASVIERLILGADEHVVVTFLANPIALLSTFGPARVRGWLEQIQASSLRSEWRQSYEIFSLAVDVLSAGEDTMSPSQKTRLRRQALAYVPPEVRSTIEGMVREFEAKTQNTVALGGRKGARSSPSKGRKR